MSQTSPEQGISCLAPGGRCSDLAGLRGRPALLVLWDLFRPVRSRLYLAWLFFFLKNLPSLIIPIVIGRVVDAIVSPPPGGIAGAIFWDCVVLAAVVLQNIPSNVISDRFFSQANFEVQARLRMFLLGKLRSRSAGTPQPFESGSLHAKLLRDAEVISLVSFQIFRAVTPAVIGIAFVLAYTLVKLPAMAALFVLAVPLAVSVVAAFRAKLAHHNESYRRSVEAISASMGSFLQGSSSKAVPGVQEQALSACSNGLERVKEKGVRLDVANAWYIAVVWVSFTLFQFVCLLISGWMAVRGIIGVGDILMYQGFVAVLVGNVAGLIGVYPEIVRGMESVRSIGEVVALEHSETPPARRVCLEVAGKCILLLAAAGVLGLSSGCGGRGDSSDPLRRRVEGLVRKLRQGQLEERKAAAEELAKLKHPSAMEPLILSLSEPQPAVRQAAVFALGEIGDRRAVPALIRTLNEDHAESRKLAVDALGKIGGEESLAPLLERLGDPEMSVRYAVGAACARLGAMAVGPLIAALKDPDPRRRAAAAFALGEVGAARAAGALLEALQDEQLPVRLAAAEALGAAGDERAAGRLVELLREPLGAAERERFQKRMMTPVPPVQAREIAQTLILREGAHHLRTRSAIERSVGKKSDRPDAVAEDMERLQEVVAEPLSPEKSAELAALVQHRIGGARFAALSPGQKETAVQREREHLRALLSSPPSEAKAEELRGLLALRFGQRWWNALNERKRQDAVLQEFLRPLQDERRCAAAEMRRAAARALARLGGAAAVRGLLEAADSPDRELSAAGEDGLQALTGSAAPLLESAALDRSLPAERRARALDLAARGGNKSLADTLPAWLKDPEASVRAVAAESLGRLGEARAMPALAAALSDPDLEVRLAAVRSLRRAGKTQAAAPLIQALRDKAGVVRAAAVEELSATADAGAAAPLLDLLRREQSGAADHRVIVACCVALGRLKAQAALDALLPLLQASGQEERGRELVVAAAEALGRIGDARAAEPLMNLLEKREWRTMQAAAKALGELGDPRAIDRLYADVHSFPEMSRIAVAALGRIRDRRATSLLAGLLRDAVVDTRKRAAEALVSQGEFATPVLIEALADENRDYRGLAAQTLGYIGTPAVEPLLKALASPPRPETVPVVMYALSVIQDERARPALIAKLRDPDAEIRANAAWALGSFGGEETRAALLKALQDGDERVRKSAQAALDRIRSSVAESIPPRAERN